MNFVISNLELQNVILFMYEKYFSFVHFVYVNIRLLHLKKGFTYKKSLFFDEFDDEYNTGIIAVVIFF